MKMHAEDKPPEGKDTIMIDPQYLRLREELENVKKGKIEVQRILKQEREERREYVRKEIEKGIQDYIDQAEAIQENAHYKIIKINKKLGQQSVITTGNL